jgi:predicted transcriptional regulator with HTH domain
MIKYHLINSYSSLFKSLSAPQGVQLDFDGEIKELTNQLTEEISQGGYSELYVMDKRAAEDILGYDYSGMPINNESLVVGHVFRLLRDAELRTKMSRGAFTWHSEYLRATYTSNYNRYLEVLFDLGVLETTVSPDTKCRYVNGEHASYYKLTNRYRERQSLCLIYREIDRRNMSTSFTKQVPYKYKQAISLSYIDYPTYVNEEIKRYVENDPSDTDRARSLESIKVRFNSAFSLLEKRYIKEGKRSTRLYHSFSNLSRIARQYLRTPNHHQFYDSDIVNSQPSFLVAFLNGKYDIDESYIKITTPRLSPFHKNFESRIERIQLRR